MYYVFMYLTELRAKSRLKLYLFFPLECPRAVENCEKMRDVRASVLVFAEKTLFY